MAGIRKKEIEIENTEIKEEIPEDILPSPTEAETSAVYINILPSPTEAETSAVYIKEEDVKVEITETKGKIKNQNI